MTCSKNGVKITVQQGKSSNVCKLQFSFSHEISVVSYVLMLFIFTFK